MTKHQAQQGKKQQLSPNVQRLQLAYEVGNFWQCRSMAQGILSAADSSEQDQQMARKFLAATGVEKISLLVGICVLAFTSIVATVSHY